MTMHPNAAARWLAAHISAIAADESAGQFYRDIETAILEIERVINRPLHPLECGPCPALTDKQQPCGAGLTAKRGAVEVTCWKCRATHNIEELIEARLHEAEYLLFTARDVLAVMGRIGQPIADRTWRRWRELGQVQPAGELYGQPGYRLADVRAMRRRYARHDADLNDKRVI